jgi:regulator of cell morphogenesis and NO signaling
MLPISAVDSTLPVNEIITRFPATIAVFNRFGIDTCCGGWESVDEAVDRDGIDREALIGALRAAIVAAS